MKQHQAVGREEQVQWWYGKEQTTENEVTDKLAVKRKQPVDATPTNLSIYTFPSMQVLIYRMIKVQRKNVPTHWTSTQDHANLV